MTTITTGIIRIYQLVMGGKSGILALTVGGGCKHSPTCSEFTITEIKKSGVILGIFRGAKRVLSCY